MLSSILGQHLFIQFGIATKKKRKKNRNQFYANALGHLECALNAKQSVKWGGEDELEMRKSKRKGNLNKNTICKEKCVLNCAKMLKKNVNFPHYVNSSSVIYHENHYEIYANDTKH